MLHLLKQYENMMELLDLHAANSNCAVSEVIGSCNFMTFDAPAA